MTGGRLKRVSHLVGETFLMTYGDGLSNVDIPKSIQFHKNNVKQYLKRLYSLFFAKRFEIHLN